MFVTVKVYCVATTYPKYVAPRQLNLVLLNIDTYELGQSHCHMLFRATVEGTGICMQALCVIVNWATAMMSSGKILIGPRRLHESFYMNTEH